MPFRYLFAPISIRSGPKISRLSEQSLQIVWTRYIPWIFHIWTCQNSLNFTVVKFTNIEMLNCKMLTFRNILDR